MTDLLSHSVHEALSGRTIISLEMKEAPTMWVNEESLLPGCRARGDAFGRQRAGKVEPSHPRPRPDGEPKGINRLLRRCLVWTFDELSHTIREEYRPGNQGCSFFSFSYRTASTEA